jgi:hypothetical protein
MSRIFCAARVRYTLLFFLLFCSSHSVLASQSIVLGWNGSPDTNVVGYSIHYGTNSGQYAFHMDVGTQTTAKLANLQEGQTYYIAITAYDTNHIESLPSGEISYIVPGLLRIRANALPGGIMLLTFPVTPPHWYEIQASSDLQSWSMIGLTQPVTSNVWMGFADIQGSALPRRFYRLRQH